MNTEDDGARSGDAEQPQQPQPNGADQDAGADSVQGAATPPPAEPPVEPPPADQPSAEQLGAESAAATGDDGVPDAESTTEPQADTAPEGAGAEATEEQTRTGHEPPGDEPFVDEPPSGADAGADTGPGASGSGPATDEYARRFLDSVDGFLGNAFREASEFVDRSTRRATPPPRAERERQAPEDHAARVLDSVEGWMGDFFRGASMARTAAGFGRAAAGSAFRARQRPDDVWSQATSGQESDASRECRYCPFCQTMAVVRGSRPELYEQIGDTAKTLVDLMRQAAEQSRRPRR